MEGLGVGAKELLHADDLRGRDADGLAHLALVASEDFAYGDGGADGACGGRDMPADIVVLGVYGEAELALGFYASDAVLRGSGSRLMLATYGTAYPIIDGFGGSVNSGLWER